MPIQIEQLADVFVDVADTLVADFDLVEFLNSVADHATGLSRGAAAGVMIVGRDETLHHIGASSENARLLELFQVQHSEGPCFEAFRTGEPVMATDVAATTERWPVFAERALGLGMASVYAFPMRLRDRVVGALNVFHTTGEEFVEAELKILQALADMATIALIQEQAISRAEVLTEQLQAALNSRITIEQAKGAIARVSGVTVDEAFELLRAYARTSRRRLTDVAHEVVTSPDGPRLLQR